MEVPYVHNRVLFVERSGELRLLARLSTQGADEKGGKSVNITKLMALMGLGVKQGDTVTVTCEGADEDKASEALKAFFEETL